jgi:hypothetical protein
MDRCEEIESSSTSLFFYSSYCVETRPMWSQKKRKKKKTQESKRKEEREGGTDIRSGRTFEVQHGSFESDKMTMIIRIVVGGRFLIFLLRRASPTEGSFAFDGMESVVVVLVVMVMEGVFVWGGEAGGVERDGGLDDGRGERRGGLRGR